MIKRLIFIFIELVAGLLGVAVLVFGILFWRLSAGPVHLGFATPYIESAVSSEEAGIEVKIQETMLVWAGWDQAFDIRIDNATILGTGGKILASLPEVTVGFSIAALFDGILAPKRLEVEGVDATIERGSDGQFLLGFFSATKPVADAEFAQRIPAYIGMLSKPRDRSSVFGYLDVVRVSNADLRYLDRANGADWHSSDSDIELLRGSDGLEAAASMDLGFGERSMQLTAHAVFSVERPVVDIDVQFQGLVPSDVTGRFVALRGFPKINKPFSGQFRVRAQHSGVINSVAFDLIGTDGAIEGNVIVDTVGNYDLTINLSGLRSRALSDFLPQITETVDIDALLDVRAKGRIGFAGEIRRLEFELNSGVGTLTLKRGLPKPLEFDSIEIAGEVRNEFEVVNISLAKLDLGKTKLEARIGATRIGQNLRTRLDAELHKLQMSDLSRFWPGELSSATRAWITNNIRSGFVGRGSISLTLDLPLLALSEPEIRSISGTFDYENLVVAYFNPFPELSSIEGTATFSHDRIDFNVTRGKLLDLSVDHGVINLTRLDTENENVSIDLVLRGPLVTALALADREPLGLAGNLGIDTTAVSGEVAARLAFQFPLSSDLRLSQVIVSSAANLRGVGVNSGPYGLALSDSDLELKLSDGTMKVSGQVLLNGVPLSIEWHEIFGDTDSVRSRYNLSGEVDASSLSHLGLPDIPALGGVIETNVIITRFGNGVTEVLASGDLERAMLSVPRLGWLKAIGEPGSFHLGLNVSEKGSSGANNFSLNMGNMEALGNIGFDNGFWTAEFAKLRIGNTELAGALSQRRDGTLFIKIDHGILDFEPVLYGIGASEPRDKEENSENNFPSITLDARFDAVRTGGEARLGATELQARFLDGELNQLVLEAALPNQKRLYASFSPEGSGHSLQFRSDDAGQALAAFGWTDKLEGGELEVEGSRLVAADPLRGGFKLSNYKLSRAPALARLLQVASLMGIVDALQRGLDFVSFDGSFSYRDGILQIDKARTYGPSIGITVEGMMDLDDYEVDLTGTVVPAYTVNRVLGQIPILGPILTGGKNEGLFAATYGVSGRLDDPTIAVNPLSALAPGFLRKLFGLIGGENSSRPDKP